MLKEQSSVQRNDTQLPVTAGIQMLLLVVVFLLRTGDSRIQGANTESVNFHRDFTSELVRLGWRDGARTEETSPLLLSRLLLLLL